MWARFVEILMAIWLLASPSALGYRDDVSLAFAAWIGAILVATFSGASLTRRWRKAHLLTLATGLGLIAWGWAAFPRPGPAGAQNLIVVGLLLGVTAIVPSRALLPPAGWRPWTTSSDHG